MPLNTPTESNRWMLHMNLHGVPLRDPTAEPCCNVPSEELLHEMMIAFGAQVMRAEQAGDPEILDLQWKRMKHFMDWMKSLETEH